VTKASASDDNKQGWKGVAEKKNLRPVPSRRCSTLIKGRLEWETKKKRKKTKEKSARNISTGLFRKESEGLTSERGQGKKPGGVENREIEMEKKREG